MVQARNLANLPFTFSHVALMPDSHEGFGMPIGGVLATNGVIIPNAVGVDIGCGMCALKTSLQDIDMPTLKKVMSGIRARIPLGFDHHKEAQDERLMPEQRRIIAGGIVSAVMTLLPGDVILTGTPAGVGQIRAGDSVSVTVEGVGTLTNPVVAAE